MSAAAHQVPFVLLLVGLTGVTGAAWWLRSRLEGWASSPIGGGPARPKSIRLSAQHRLHVVEVAGRTLVVGTGPAGPPSLLIELDGPSQPPALRACTSAQTPPPPPGDPSLGTLHGLGARRGA